MLKNHYKIYLAVLVGLILFIILIGLIFLSGNEDNPESLAGNSYREEFKESIFKQIDRGAAPLSYKQESKQSVENFFSNIEAIENSLPKTGAEQTSQSLAKNIFQATTTTKLKSFEGIKEITISERPVKEILPDYYIDYVGKLTDVLKKENFISQNEKIVFIKTGDVFDFLINSFDHFVNLGAISKENYQKEYYGLTYIWPRTLEMEFGGISSLNNRNKIEKNSFSNNILSRILFLMGEAVSTKTAFAVDCSPRVPDCYRFGAPKPEGVNLWASCCNCCVSHDPPIPIGCLNAVCPPPNSAIWDPMTGICGCG